MIKATTPIEIPDNLHAPVDYRGNGYYQAKYVWNDGTYKYEVRWHEKTPGAPEGTLPNWRVDRIIPGTPGGGRDSETGQKIKGTQTTYERGVREEDGNIIYVSREDWKKAEDAYHAGVMVPEQEELMKKGHIEPKIIETEIVDDN